jgi:hypothetical protein
MSDGFRDRLIRESGINEIVESLTERLSPSDLQSLLLEVYARVSARSTPTKVLEQYRRDRFVQPSVIDPRVLGELDRIAWSMLPSEYQPIELGPLCPIGTCSAVATVSQNKIVTTIRNTEVASDNTNVMALECATRRRREPSSPAFLASSQRLTRAQGLPGPRSWAHFRLLSLCAAGRCLGSYAFELNNALAQITFYLRYFDALMQSGWRVAAPRVAVTDMLNGQLTPRIESQLLAPLGQMFPHASIALDPSRTSGRGYYQSICFKLYVRERAGAEMEIGDGGDVPWTQKLLSNAKERLIISAVAQERLGTVGPGLDLGR